MRPPTNFSQLGSEPNDTPSPQEADGAGQMEKEPKFVVLDDPELKKYIAKPVSEVIDYIKTKYGNRVPSFDEHQKYIQYLCNDPDKVPEQLKDGKFYHFLGVQDGLSNVPYVQWYGGKLNWSVRSVDFIVGEKDRFLLLEK